MKRPTLLEGVLVALVLSLLAAPIVVLLHGLVGSLLAWKAVVVVMAYTYMCYLLVQRGRTSGRITLGLLALAGLLAGVAFDLRLTGLLLLCVALIWGVRSFAYSRSLVSAVLQGGVCVLGCGAALMVYGHSGSFALAIWSFFLVQAAFVFIPARFTRRPLADRYEEVRGAPNSFGHAHHAAEEALDRRNQGGWIVLSQPPWAARGLRADRIRRIVYYASSS